LVLRFQKYGLGILDPEKNHPGSRSQSHWIPDPDPQHWIQIWSDPDIFFHHSQPGWPSFFMRLIHLCFICRPDFQYLGGYRYLTHSTNLASSLVYGIHFILIPYFFRISRGCSQSVGLHPTWEAGYLIFVFFFFSVKFRYLHAAKRNVKIQMFLCSCFKCCSFPFLRLCKFSCNSYLNKIIKFNQLSKFSLWPSLRCGFFLSSCSLK
jgi:hypothetical protein